MKKTPEQKNKLLEKQNNLLAHQLEIQSEKAIFFDMMIDFAEKDLNIEIRKKCLPEQSTRVIYRFLTVSVDCSE